MSEKNRDRISGYLSVRLHDMVFVELSEDYLDRIGASDILTGVPVPLNSGNDADGGEITVKDIVLDMARVIGGDPSFVYSGSYLEFIKRAVGTNAVAMLVSEGARSADRGDLIDACMLLRAALKIDPKSKEALYLYARACKECYERESELSEEGSGDEEKTGMFKAESMETFELLTMIHPDFAMGYYFLGYAYLNMGLYLKAQLTWRDFLKFSSAGVGENSGTDDETLGSLREEISSRLEELNDPVEIERGCNMIMSGNFAGGREVLDKFRESRFSNWWPLWYYLATAESALGNSDEAIKFYRKVLSLSPSNTEVMEELAAVYALTGDEENAAKYRRKIKIINGEAPDTADMPHSGQQEN